MLCLLGSNAFAAKHALLIAISDYSGTGFDSLTGTHNDVELMRTVLVNRFGLDESNIQVVLDEQATHLGLEAEFFALAERIAPGDMVYIHYSGHGSFTRDLNGDEERSGRDSTWVSYGSRWRGGVADASDLDNYDVLDDEIDVWLARVLEKTQHVVFVSDSCHSASVTRGDAPIVRAIPADDRPHPAGVRSLRGAADTSMVIRIGAAGDAQGAAEFRAEDNDRYGLFTWYWAAALSDASPAATWDEVFRQAATQVQLLTGTSQQPQMEGDRTLRLFGGEFSEPTRSVVVTQVRSNAETVRFEAGLLVGMTVGSVFTSPRQGEEAGDLARVEIVQVQATRSEAVVLQGEIEVGDLLLEESHVYPFDPIGVYVAADYPDEDAALLSVVRDTVASLGAYELVSSQQNSQIVLYVARSRRDPQGRLEYADVADTLPVPDSDAGPEVWVLTPVEVLINDRLRISFDDADRGRTILEQNLSKLAQLREIRSLGDRGPKPAFSAMTILMVPDSACVGTNCFDVPSLGLYRIAGRTEFGELVHAPKYVSDILTYTITNSTSRDYYVYLLSVSADGAISSLFPYPGDRQDVALLKPGQTLDLFELGYGHILEVPGEETLQLITSRNPIATGLLGQSGYVTRSNTAGVSNISDLHSSDLNPLERLLARVMGVTRGDIPVRNDSWGIQQVSFEVLGR